LIKGGTDEVISTLGSLSYAARKRSRDHPLGTKTQKRWTSREKLERKLRSRI